MKSLQYLSILILPATVSIAFTQHHGLTFLPMIVFFVFVPLLEFFIKPDKKNFTKEEAAKEKEKQRYSFILYLALPIQLFFLGFFFFAIQEESLATYEIVGRILAMGLMCGVLGINIGHELGHRQHRGEQLLGEILLLTSLNTHFLPYHNGGHHFNVATPKDAATARKNETVYTFYFRSHFSSYLQAWQLENKRLKERERNWFHIQNRMLIYTLCNLLFLGSIYYFFGGFVLLCFIAAAVFGIVNLETVNYIEHYGLLRTKNKYGRYERVKHTHSWNSDHVIGRALLFNLSRHSDHHYNGSKPYQILNSLPESPQMPTGYPGMMLFALVPFLWFWFMNKKVEKIS